MRAREDACPPPTTDQSGSSVAKFLSKREDFRSFRSFRSFGANTTARFCASLVAWQEPFALAGASGVPRFVFGVSVPGLRRADAERRQVRASRAPSRLDAGCRLARVALRRVKPCQTKSGAVRRTGRVAPGKQGRIRVGHRFKLLQSESGSDKGSQAQSNLVRPFNDCLQTATVPPMSCSDFPSDEAHSEPGPLSRRTRCLWRAQSIPK